MRAGIGNDRLVVCLSEYLPLRIVYRISSMSTIGKWFVSRIYRRILLEMPGVLAGLRKSCSCRRFRYNPFPLRRTGASVFDRDRVLAFVSSGVMINIKSIGRHIGHDSSVGVCIAKRSRIYRIESAIRHG